MSGFLLFLEKTNLFAEIRDFIRVLFHLVGVLAGSGEGRRRTVDFSVRRSVWGGRFDIVAVKRDGWVIFLEVLAFEEYGQKENVS